jgi:hypothetical protein
MKIENPASCEIRSVIKFLNAENVLRAEIYRKVCEVYGENAMSDGMVRRWRKMDWRQTSTRGHRNLCPGMTDVSVWVAIMSRSSSKHVNL